MCVFSEVFFFFFFFVVIVSVPVLFLVLPRGGSLEREREGIGNLKLRTGSFVSLSTSLLFFFYPLPRKVFAPGKLSSDSASP